jgi:hypothetical protein
MTPSDPFDLAPSQYVFASGHLIAHAVPFMFVAVPSCSALEGCSGETKRLGY